MSAAPTPPTGFAPETADFYQADPDEAFRYLRQHDPVHWYEAGGFWCITRHRDVQEVSRLPRRFSSERGTQLFQITDPEQVERVSMGVGGGGAPSIIMMDPPRHNRHRKLVIGEFTPRKIAAMEDRIRRITRDCLARIDRGAELEFVESVAVPVPMIVIAEMLGVPQERNHEFRRWSDAMIEVGGGNFDEAAVAVMGELFAYCREVVVDRRKRPADDLISLLLQGEVDGERLTDDEMVMFCLTLLVAGNETTRNLITGGTRLLMEHPEQQALLRREPARIPNAVEEMLRYVTPVRNFARCATRDTELRGRTIRAGQYVLLCYASANRDEEIFGPDSHEFDVTRESARRHLAFGFGEHLCLGAALARLEGRVVFEELLAAAGSLELAGEIEPLPSTLMNGLVRMPVRFAA